jgi:hypothetical protein
MNARCAVRLSNQCQSAPSAGAIRAFAARLAPHLASAGARDEAYCLALRYTLAWWLDIRSRYGLEVSIDG